MAPNNDEYELKSRMREQALRWTPDQMKQQLQQLSKQVPPCFAVWCDQGCWALEPSVVDYGTGR